MMVRGVVTAEVLGEKREESEGENHKDDEYKNCGDGSPAAQGNSARVGVAGGEHDGGAEDQRKVGRWDGEAHPSGHRCIHASLELYTDRRVPCNL